MSLRSRTSRRLQKRSTLRHFVIALAMLMLPLGSVSAQTTSSPGAGNATPGAVRILLPKNGAKITHNFVDIRYELAAPTAAGSPTFQVHLDSAEPVRTTDTRYTFTGLNTGRHTAAVEVVDANNIPVQGSRAEVSFHVVASPAQPASPAPRSLGGPQLVSAVANEHTNAHLVNTSLPQDEAPAPEEHASNTLPQSGSSLPLLVLIGAGILAGGIVSALRTRPGSRYR